MNARLRLVLAAVAVVALAVAALFLPLGRWALALVESVRGAGALGVVIYGLVYVVATVLWIPGSVLTIAAGFVYGLIGGTLVVIPSSVAGATLAFVIARFLARDWVRARLMRHPRLAAVDAAIGERGFSIVMLLRLSPLFPFVALNYALGLTKVRLRDYVLASVVGMIPGTFLFVYIGTLVTDAAALAAGERPDAGLAQRLLFWGGLVASAAVTVWISRLAQRKLAGRLVLPVEDEGEAARGERS
ncbi:TVP38/TMEM64 family protein [Haliangium sp.]|uniref:TVP38/TMEM64 family protein n=1 Tax=Haliangium sp. TaxID=2663208 RepID=UPI003D1093A1